MSATTYDAIIREVGSRQGVDPAFIKAIIAHETGGTFDPRSFRAEPGGLVGSVGLMQILPSTAQGVGFSGAVGDRNALTGLWNPAENIARGTAYLKQMLNRAAGNIAAAASAYNGGWRPDLGFGIPAMRQLRICLAKDTTGKCIRWRDVAPGEFANKPYVDDVLRLYAIYKNEMPPAATPSTPPQSGGGGTSRVVAFQPSALGLVVLGLVAWWAKLKKKKRGAGTV